MKALNPGFIVDLGDTFMRATLAMSQIEVEQRYIDVKKQFDLFGNIPIYLVTGNRDGENGFNTKMLEVNKN